MGAVELRKKIIRLLDTDNVGYLRDVFEFAESKKSSGTEQDIVAHTMDGQPITKEEYIENNRQAVASFKKGDFKTQGEMLKKYSTK